MPYFFTHSCYHLFFYLTDSSLDLPHAPDLTMLPLILATLPTALPTTPTDLTPALCLATCGPLVAYLPGAYLPPVDCCIFCNARLDWDHAWDWEEKGLDKDGLGFSPDPCHHVCLAFLPPTTKQAVLPVPSSTYQWWDRMTYYRDFLPSQLLWSGS